MSLLITSILVIIVAVFSVGYLMRQQIPEVEDKSIKAFETNLQKEINRLCNKYNVEGNVKIDVKKAS